MVDRDTEILSSTSFDGKFWGPPELENRRPRWTTLSKNRLIHQSRIRKSVRIFIQIPVLSTTIFLFISERNLQEGEFRNPLLTRRETSDYYFNHPRAVSCVSALC